MVKKRGGSRKDSTAKKQVGKIVNKSLDKSSSKKLKMTGRNGKKIKKKGKNGNHHPLLAQELTPGQRAADKIAEFGGSWTFILTFMFFLAFWIGFNTWYLASKSFDPYPFILLNLLLSCLAAIQAPIILMAQNRQAERDRVDAKYDHQINRKAEREIQQIQRDLHSIRRMVKRLHDK